ncbi:MULTISPECIES: energy-coupling factor ABC transporter permease [unclassified Methanobrevibacter]|uniref:energy-coupling factor ABC transporter permease n=1 Tax=unclassified Methanobrevibacter TaxID=2638681 RepID=UPI0025DA8205|nr:ECF transporter S component [Methanobrevibacter sp. UBA212]
MHIPDGLIPFEQALAYLIVSLVILSIFFYYTSKKVDMEKRLVLTGVLTAIVVVATSFTIPSPMGVQIHFFIIPLVVFILGPFNASLVSFLALLVQALALGEGGVTALGANVLDMGIVLSLVVYAVYKLFSSIDRRIAIFVSTVMGIIAATFMQIFILAIANASSLEVLLASLLPYYLMVAIMEGIMNIVIMEFISRMDNSILDIEKV